MQTESGRYPRRRQSIHFPVAHDQGFHHSTSPSYTDEVEDELAQENGNELQAPESWTMDGDLQYGSEATLQERMDSLSFGIHDGHETLWDEIGKIGE
jgi:hypothetical protein